MPATRISIRFTGSIVARSEPIGSESGALVIGVKGDYAATGWQTSTMQGRINSASFVALPWQAGQVAKIIGLQVRSGPPLRVRITRQITALAIVDAAPVYCGSFRDLDGVTLLEVAGDGVTATEFEWLAAGD